MAISYIVYISLRFFIFSIGKLLFFLSVGYFFLANKMFEQSENEINENRDKEISKTIPLLLNGNFLKIIKIGNNNPDPSWVYMLNKAYKGNVECDYIFMNHLNVSNFYLYAGKLFRNKKFFCQVQYTIHYLHQQLWNASKNIFSIVEQLFSLGSRWNYIETKRKDLSNENFQKLLLLRANQRK